MSDINRLQPICEACGLQYGLTLTACSGGAVGDVYLCRVHFTEHIAYGRSEACSECLAIDEQNQALYQFLL